MAEPCRLLVDDPAGGAWNMAVDEVLLDSAAAAGASILRLYQWTPATLSLGYFQRAADRRAHASSRCCPLVRRLTGGGAIVHDRELTYSLVVCAGHSWARHTQDLYRGVHATLVELFGQWGLAASMVRQPAADEPFLCFARRAVGDVVVGEHKLVGSAQRRRAGVVLQHGSILLARSGAAPELPGLDDLLGRSTSPRTFAEAWLPRLADAGGWRLSSGALDAAESAAAAELAAGKFASAAWNDRR